MWRLVVPRSVLRSLERISTRDRQRLAAAIEAMTENPFGGDFRKLAGNECRLRVGSYRILYEIDREQRIVEIHEVVRRTSTTY